MAFFPRLAITMIAALSASACVNGPQNISATQKSEPDEILSGAPIPNSPEARPGLAEIGGIDGSEQVNREPDAQFSALAEGRAFDREADVGRETLTAEPNNPGISDEQEFEAVASRETIESDAERLKRLRSQYKLVKSEHVPERPDDINVAAYALSTENLPGEKLYRRVYFGKQRPISERCASYATDDDAQHVFLSQGGPEDDPLHIDPDGDGFACNWSPIPFRRLFQ
ncbi:MAG: hypothetical protein OXI87_12280 [Albidovulum sp.]|nr:hypothetical protein [Albidovulum sp.]MDE0305636.1 hypothetical protein [Albidovulum sp.]